MAISNSTAGLSDTLTTTSASSSESTPDAAAITTTTSAPSTITPATVLPTSGSVQNATYNGPIDEDNSAYRSFCTGQYQSYLASFGTQVEVGDLTYSSPISSDAESTWYSAITEFQTTTVIASQYPDWPVPEQCVGQKTLC